MVWDVELGTVVVKRLKVMIVLRAVSVKYTGGQVLLWAWEPKNGGLSLMPG